MIRTPRLLLRPWRETDREAFAELCQDQAVMYWLGGVLSRAQSDAYLDRCDRTLEAHGYCRWAVETRAEGDLVGAVGLMQASAPQLAEGTVEIGWRLVGRVQGQGLATEAARAALEDGFNRCGVHEILSYTTVGNLRSQAVMARLSLRRRSDLDFVFDAVSQPELRPHLVWSAAPPG